MNVCDLQNRETPGSRLTCFFRTVFRTFWTSQTAFSVLLLTTTGPGAVDVQVPARAWPFAGSAARLLHLPASRGTDLSPTQTWHRGGRLVRRELTQTLKKVEGLCLQRESQGTMKPARSKQRTASWLFVCLLCVVFHQGDSTRSLWTNPLPTRVSTRTSGCRVLPPTARVCWPP